MSLILHKYKEDRHQEHETERIHAASENIATSFYGYVKREFLCLFGFHDWITLSSGKDKFCIWCDKTKGPYFEERKKRKERLRKEELTF